MQVGLFSEGPSDHAVISNILKGVLDIDRSDITYLSPDLQYDETDLSQVQNFGSWTIVKAHCENKSEIANFITSPGTSRFVIIQIDSAERNDQNYNVLEPTDKRNRLKEYSKELRVNIINKINEWLDGQYTEKIVFAICIEEIEAWLLAQCENLRHDTSRHGNVKEYYDSNWHLIFSPNGIKKLRGMKIFDRYLVMSDNFSKKKKLTEFRKYNQSLDDFCSDLETMFQSLS